MTSLFRKDLGKTSRKDLGQPIRFAEEYCVPSSKQRKKPTTDNNLYEIELNRDRNLVRIYYKGYSEKFDEWRPILLRLRPVELMSLIKFSHFLVYIYIYIYIYLTRSVIYTIF